MDWITAVQQTSTSSSPVWLAPLLGGVGAVLGGSLTSTVAWRVLSDTKKARQRAEEKDATAVITTALLKVRQTYRNYTVGSGPIPEGFDDWSAYFVAELDEAEVAAMMFHSEALRQRLTSSLQLLMWGAYDQQLLYETRLGNANAVAYAAHQDAMACLGANLRGEALPEAQEAWKNAEGQMQWQLEQERRAERGE